MAEPIDFYFDFASPYGYIASHRIDDIAARHGREVTWRPFLLGVAFQRTGMPLVSEQGIRGEYVLHDFGRCARFYGVPFRIPDVFPIMAVNPSRVYYWRFDQDPAAAKDLVRALWSAYFVDNRDISKAETIAEVAAAQGLDGAAVAAALQDQAVKDRLRQETEAAIERGAFGSPHVIVDGEAFWGNDRLDMVDKWLETGGW
jgi:2-hydroxychromene-2-carboxylate isomerase